MVCPIRPEKLFDEARTFAKGVSQYLADKDSENYTVATRKEQRNGRLFSDYLRNAYGQTSIPPYSVRALEGAEITHAISKRPENK